MEMDTTHTLNFDVPETLWVRAKEEADRLGIPVASLIKVILANHFDEKSKKE